MRFKLTKYSFFAFVLNLSIVVAMCLAPSDAEAKCGGARNCPDYTVGWGPTGYCHGWGKNVKSPPSFRGWHYVNSGKNAYVTLDYIHKNGGCEKLLKKLQIQEIFV